MADLIAKFQLIDEMSQKLGRIAEKGAEMIDSFKMAGQAANEAFGKVEGVATGIAHSIDKAVKSTESYESSMVAAGGATDYSTIAIDNYNISALEAIRMMAEITQMSSRSAEALGKQERMFKSLEQQVANVNGVLEDHTSANSKLSSAAEATSKGISNLSDIEKTSKNAKDELASASKIASDALKGLEDEHIKIRTAASDSYKIIDEGTSIMKAFRDSVKGVSEAFQNLDINSKVNAIETLSTNSSTASVNILALEGATQNLQGTMENCGSNINSAAMDLNNLKETAIRAFHALEALFYINVDETRAMEELSKASDQAGETVKKFTESQTGAKSEVTNCEGAINSESNNLGSLEVIVGKVIQAFEVLSSTSTNQIKAMEDLSKSIDNAESTIKTAIDSQSEMKTGLENCSTAVNSLTDNLGSLGKQEEAAAKSGEQLANNQEKVAEAAKESADSNEKSGKKIGEAFQSINEIFEEIQLVDKMKEIAGAAYDLAKAFSEAESTIVTATGASGDALDSLMESTMNAYGAAKNADLGSTAGAIGEINTRMGLTGESLTDVTGLFLDFASITGTDVVGSIQNVTKIMNKWGVEGNEVEDVLDKLAYAGQVSGISVDNLNSTLVTGAATFQEMGLSLDSTISMLSQFELYGINGTTAVSAMNTAVKNFSDNGLNAETALQSVIGEIANMESTTEATALAVDTFGSKAGRELSSAIRSGAISVDTLSQSLDAADGTLVSTADAAQTLEQKWQQANNNIGSAFSKVLSPVIEEASGAFAGFLNGIGDILNKVPVVTSILSALGVGIAVVVIGTAALSAGIAIATPIMAAFGITVNVALGPIMLVVGAVAALAAGIAMLVNHFKGAEDETEGMTAVTRDQYYELENLNSEYKEACETYGETSEEALRLKYQVDDLSSSFEANRQTVEEFSAECDELIESSNKLTQSYHDNMDEIHNNEVGTLSLIQKLEDLATANNKTAASEEQMKSLIDQLNQDLPGLALTYEDVTQNTDKMVESMKKAAEAQAEQERFEESKRTYVEKLKEQAALEEQIAKAEENIRLEQERRDNMSDWDRFFAGDDDLKKYKEELEGLQTSYKQNEELIAGIEQKWEDVAKASEEANNQMSGEQIAATVYEGYKTQIEELCTAYDEVYQSALSSFEGQFGLFDKASTESEAYMNSTVGNAQAALDSQLEYWNSYSSNLETLKSKSADDLGITQDNYDMLMSYVQDGSEEAAGLAQSLVQNIEAGNEEAVAKLATTVSEVSLKQKEVADTTADWVTGFSTEMDGIEKEMQDSIQNMNLSSEAEKAATDTINGYIESIKKAEGGAVQAAKNVADSVTRALQSANTTLNIKVNRSGDVAEDNHYATGTLDAAPGLALVGEEGPELVNFGGGEVVYTADETKQIFNTYEKPLSIEPESDSRAISGQENGNRTLDEEKKHIVLELAGSGEIGVGSEVNKETVLNILQEKLKPILMNIINTEIYEEGVLSYNF